MNIRRATIEDLKNVQELNSELFKKEDQDFGQNFDDTWSFSEDGTKCINGWIQNENSAVFVAEEENKIVGYAAGEIRELPVWRKKSKAAELVEIFLLNGYRGQGIGSEFLEKFIEWCKGKGVERIKIEASFGNADGIRFYKKHGFHEQEMVLEKEL